jgi:hypothetical protein
MIESRERVMKKLEIDLADLTIAFESSDWEINHYLDLETGQVIVVDAEIQRQLEDLCVELDDTGVELPNNLVEVLRERGLPEWEQEAMLEADEIERGGSSRYIGIPQDDSHTAYNDMEDFVGTVQDDYLRGCLSSAIVGRGAFRRFKDVLLDDPRERDRWFAFKDEQVQQRALGWLAVQDIEPIIIEPSPEVLEPDSPSARALLIDEVSIFVRAACQLPGVLRIALIGSLTTDKPDPKDADMLVTVTDDADLEPLATLGRKLTGHAQSFQRGGDVFLADPRGNYLGRTCPWRVCAPGVRMRCDALNCGRRPYLHDDWEAIRLNENLIVAPPIELWPEIVSRVPVPEDVEQELIVPLREEMGQRGAVKDVRMSKQRQQISEREWEQALIDAYYDHRWRQVLDPLYEKFQRWKAGELTHADMDQAIHETQKQNQELYTLFREGRSFLLPLIQCDRNWFRDWVADNPPPPGVELVPFPG